MREWGGRLVAGIICLMIVPKPFALSAFGMGVAPGRKALAVSRPIADSVAFIRNLQLPAPVRVLTLNDGLGTLLGPGFQEVKAWQKKDRSLEAYAREKDVGLIVSFDAGKESFIVSDPFWKAIHEHPETVGFKQLSVPGHPRVNLYVRDDLASKGNL